MRPNLLLIVLLVCLAVSAQAEEISLNGQQFTLAPGFGLELVATAPLVERPIAADFDEEGHLYVTESSGSNDKVEVQLREQPHLAVARAVARHRACAHQLLAHALAERKPCQARIGQFHEIERQLLQLAVLALARGLAGTLVGIVVHAPASLVLAEAIGDQGGHGIDGS